jgi:signal transduction histidine kinase
MAVALRHLVAVGGGHGLAGMRERVQLTGGTLTVGPTGDGGWRVEAVLPRAPVQDGPRP